jgi:formylglycine-generating enzyme required for sulfatase activity
MTGKANQRITAAAFATAALLSGCDIDWTTVKEDDTAYETYRHNSGSSINNNEQENPNDHNDGNGDKSNDKYQTEKTNGGTIFIINNVRFTMVDVEGGTFKMGMSPDVFSDDIYWYESYKYNALPIHNTTVSSYKIGQTEVTCALWNAVMNDIDNYDDWDKDRPYYACDYNGWLNFINALNKITGKKFRMPTEAEWEYAARGGKFSKGFKYSGSNNLDEVAFGYDILNEGNVAQKKPNELGLYDMSGNVSEWCSDYAGSYFSDDAVNPAGPSQGTAHIIRGSGNSYHHCLVGFRDQGEGTGCGLRLVLQTSNDDPQYYPIVSTLTPIIKNIVIDDYYCGQLVKVEGGSFMMGSPLGVNNSDWSYPFHKVTLDSYYILQDLVSYNFYNKVMFNEDTYETNEISLTWNECNTFCEKLSQLTGKKFRLPTEAEWEYAYKGGTHSLNNSYKYYGQELGFNINGDEWCADWFYDYTEEAAVNPIMKEPVFHNGELVNQKVIRGIFADPCYRQAESPDESNYFRIVMEIE